MGDNDFSMLCKDIDLKTFLYVFSRMNILNKCHLFYRQNCEYTAETKRSEHPRDHGNPHQTRESRATEGQPQH